MDSKTGERHGRRTRYRGKKDEEEIIEQDEMKWNRRSLVRLGYPRIFRRRPVRDLDFKNFVVIYFWEVDTQGVEVVFWKQTSLSAKLWLVVWSSSLLYFSIDKCLKPFLICINTWSIFLYSFLTFLLDRYLAMLLENNGWANGDKHFFSSGLDLRSRLDDNVLLTLDLFSSSWATFICLSCWEKQHPFYWKSTYLQVITKVFTAAYTHFLSSLISLLCCFDSNSTTR